MRNFVHLILAVSGAFLFDQGHSSHQNRSESCEKVSRTREEIDVFPSVSRSRGDSLLSQDSNQNLDLNSEAIPSKDRLYWRKGNSWHMGATYEVYTNRKRDGTSEYFSSSVKARHGDAILLIMSVLDPNQKLYLLVHGWLGSSASISSIFGSSSSSRQVKDEELAQIKNGLLRVENATVIVVDWSEKANTTYSVARKYSFSMAFTLAMLVGNLVEVGALNVSKVHYIGHSLGAQAARFFAQTLKCIRNGQKIGRITGLDPANEGFEDEHLDREDADFVDVIHTSTGILKLGMREPIGHVDFYPDGGFHQYGCGFPGCSHSRAKIYYLNSIGRCEYRSQCCTSGAEVSSDKIGCSVWKPACGRMGHHASSDLRGVHIVNINSDYPHCGL